MDYKNRLCSIQFFPPEFLPNNENTKSNELCKEYLKNQLVYSGIQEAVKSRKNGFPIRLTFVDFLTR